MLQWVYTALYSRCKHQRRHTGGCWSLVECSAADSDEVGSTCSRPLVGSTINWGADSPALIRCGQSGAARKTQLA